ncbi:MAG: serine hydrolase domain-containing protein, partial [Candidatus Hodarchaeota archaeon]
IRQLTIQSLVVVLFLNLGIGNVIGLSTETWKISSPEAVGMSSTKLNQMLELIETDNIPIDSIIIIRSHHLVFEEYPNPQYDEKTRHDVCSVTKSFTSALIGIMIGQGLIKSVDQKIIDLFPNKSFSNLDSRKQNITLKHLLTLTAGLEWDEETYPANDTRNDFYQLENSYDAVQYVLDKPMVAEPGTLFNYNTGASHVLSALIAEITGNSTLDFAQEYLFDPLGISDVQWNQNHEGIYKGGAQLYLRPQAMAKLGYLYLKNGTWEGQQVIPAEWVVQSTKTYIIGKYFRGSGYGYHWWTLPEYDYFFAAGAEGQMIYVLPGYNMVVTFTASIHSGENFPRTLLHDYILPSVENTTTSFTTSTETADSNGFELTFLVIFGLFVVPVLRGKKKT